MLIFPPQGIWTVVLSSDSGSDSEDTSTGPKVKFSLLPMTSDRTKKGDDLSAAAAQTVSVCVLLCVLDTCTCVQYSDFLVHMAMFTTAEGG